MKWQLDNSTSLSFYYSWLDKLLYKLEKDYIGRDWKKIMWQSDK